MSTSTSRARAGGYGYAFPHQKWWDQRLQIERAAQTGTLQVPRKTAPVEYRFEDGESLHIAVGKHLLRVTVRRMELPGGKPGYRVKADEGAENERDETTLIKQHEAAVEISRSILMQREHGGSLVQWVKQLDPSVKLWLSQLPVMVPVTPGFLISQ